MITLCFTYSIIMCAKSRSADVYIIISANNVLKSVHRNIMKMRN